MNGSLFSITSYMNRVCFKVSGGTSVQKLPPSYPPPPLEVSLPRIYEKLSIFIRRIYVKMYECMTFPDIEFLTPETSEKKICSPLCLLSFWISVSATKYLLNIFTSTTRILLYHNSVVI